MRPMEDDRVEAVTIGFVGGGSRDRATKMMTDWNLDVATVRDE